MERWRSLHRLILFHTLEWRHNGHDSVSNHQPHDRLLNRLFRRRSKKTSKLRVTGLCVGNSPGTGEFPAQMASNAENVSIWWRHHKILNGHSPPYVRDIILMTVSERTHYGLHNANELTTFPTRISLYYNPFFPKVIREWNKLDETERAIDDLDAFKLALKMLKSNPLYCTGPRKYQIRHTGLQLKRSSLQSHLYDNRHTDTRSHYCDVIMTAMASQITSLTIVYSTVYSGADQRKHQSSASLAFVWWIHRWPVNSPHKGPVTRKMSPFDDVIMLASLGPR